MMNRIWHWLALGVVAVTGIVTLRMVVFFADGRILVLAPPDESVTVRVDGAHAATVLPGRHGRIVLARGTHEVQLTIGARSLRPREFEIAGLDRWLVVGDADRCFVLADLTGRYTGTQPPAVVAARFRGDPPLELPDGVWFADEALPTELREDQSVRTVRELPSCASFDAPDAELLAAVGL